MNATIDWNNAAVAVGYGTRSMAKPQPSSQVSNSNPSKRGEL